MNEQNWTKSVENFSVKRIENDPAVGFIEKITEIKENRGFGEVYNPRCESKPW